MKPISTDPKVEYKRAYAREYMARVRADDPGRYQRWEEARNEREPNWRQEYDRKRKYGVTREQYAAMFLEQNGVCALCGLPERFVNRINGLVDPLSIDHNHSTNHVRGLLCRNCNRQLAWYEEKMATINAYLAQGGEDG
jgi:hypothetical protein